MSELIYISRNFVEFGAFKPDEILDFKKRGILADTDYLRHEISDGWLTVEQWLAGNTTNGVSEPAPAAPKKAPAPAKKKASTKKAT